MLAELLSRVEGENRDAAAGALGQHPARDPIVGRRDQRLKHERLSGGIASGSDIRCSLLLDVVHVCGGGRITDLHRPHQPAVRVIEDVAVEHPVAGTLVEGHEKPGGGLHRDVDGVFPRQRPSGCALVVQQA